MKTQFFNNKKVIVTGGTGLIGASLSNVLQELGANVTAISVDDPKRVKKVLKNPDNHLYLDLRDAEKCIRSFDNADIVVNLMGIRESTQLGIKKSGTAMSAFLECNTNIIQAACLNKVGTYLFCGSINQYPPLAIRHEDSVWDGLPSANDRYVGVSKRVGELQAEAYSKQFNWDAVKIIRPSNVYGPMDNFDPETAHVIPSLIYKFFYNKNDVLNVAGDGSSIRDFIYIDDLIQGILLVLENGKVNRPYNLGSGVGHTIKEVVKFISNFDSSKIEIKWDTEKPSGDTKRILDISRAKKEIAFKPTMGLQEGINTTMKWFLKNKKLAFNFGRTYDKKYEI